ncbi:CpsD/CapB family tyrosine-protein kinase [Pseudaminobacter sp. 19-2017]|uniref:CpsD/CapB family tyrosine-protein kinase n=1 Tax=Pseudaminobacter soli (ex Zhang et al. 2022) TaxID=2831468 RepID=A0A942I2X3_9HYPH|nr:CpsD/CapB family tyrosine-protein kinase [Pseudaminobacter soli]MBS3649428.1 CpsD/CapB family tyrosine-protein kinase [Pseudaminobacter soli]
MAKEQDSFASSPEALLTSARSRRNELWTRLRTRQPDHQLLARNRIVTSHRSDPAHATFDVMRTRILQVLRQNKWTSLAITSPSPGCGKTVTALNLAFSLAHQKDCRTVMLDLDLRRPQTSKLLGVQDAPCMENFLNGRSNVEDVFLRFSENLAIGANRFPVGFAAELLQSAGTAKVLEDMKQKLEPDVVLFDLPPLLCGDDVLAFLPSVDCAILVVAAGSSKLSEIDACEEDISSKTNMLGVVLNKCWYAPEIYGYQP